MWRFSVLFCFYFIFISGASIPMMYTQAILIVIMIIIIFFVFFLILYSVVKIFHFPLLLVVVFLPFSMNDTKTKNKWIVFCIKELQDWNVFFFLSLSLCVCVCLLFNGFFCCCCCFVQHFIAKHCATNNKLKIRRKMLEVRKCVKERMWGLMSLPPPPLFLPFVL